MVGDSWVFHKNLVKYWISKPHLDFKTLEQKKKKIVKKKSKKKRLKNEEKNNLNL